MDASRLHRYGGAPRQHPYGEMRAVMGYDHGLVAGVLVLT